MKETEVLVVKEFKFDAAHYLPNYKRACSNLHGHTFYLQIGIKGEIDLTTGMVVDFNALKKSVEAAVISKLDHTLINKVAEELELPTAENLVCWIRERLRYGIVPVDRSKENAPHLAFIRLYETPSSYVEWHEE